MMSEKKIFVVEDEAIVSMALEDALGQLGYIISGTATNGKDALERIGETHPDLVLMDIRIQGDMDGIETAEKVSSSFNVPVVYLTAHSDEKTLERAIATQPYGYLLKPFRTRELYSTIEIALYKHRLMTREPVTPAVSRENPVRSPAAITLEHAVLGAMEVPVCVINRELKVIYLNPSCTGLLERLGCTQTTTGRNILDICPPSLSGSAKELKGIFETGLTRESMVTLDAGGRQEMRAVTKFPLKEHGNVSFIVFVFRDVTNESLLRERLCLVSTHNESVVSRLGEITRITWESSDPGMKKIADQVSEILIAITKLESKI